MFREITRYEHKFLAKINWAQKHKISGNFGATSRKVRGNLRETSSNLDASLVQPQGNLESWISKSLAYIQLHPVQAPHRLKFLCTKEASES